ncbi:MAG: hypothetical protein H6555_13115 [Lewinellaceae bacterium]|nr:hypothetical protein [Lewinellaceae bacterium]
MNRLGALVWILLIGSCPLWGQRGWELGGWLGASHYFGDLNTSYSLRSPHLAGGVVARFNFNNRVCVKFSGNYGEVSADDALSNNVYERARNLSFRSSIIDGAAQIEFNFLPYTHGSRDEYFTPYLFGGFSAFAFNPQAQYQGEWVDLRPLGTEGQFRGEEYYTVSGTFVYGIGLKFDVTPRWSVNLEFSARNAFTDHLDDVSTVYADSRDLLRQRGPIAVALADRSLDVPGVDNSQLGRPGSQRGNANNKDHFAFLQAGMVYYFGSLRCPTISRK